MVFGNRERFWIALIVRFAFGFMFLTSAINIFVSDWDPNLTAIQNSKQNLRSFVNNLSRPYQDSWINIKYSSREKDPATGAPARVTEIGMAIVRAFLYAMPFIFALFSVLLLTGFFLLPALRGAALFLVLLGLGKYLTDFKSGNTLTTLQDFTYAMFITLALFALSRESSTSP